MERREQAVSVNASLRELFRAVADVPAEERELILAERRIPADLRREVESLLRYDSGPAESLTRRVSEVAEDAARWGHGPVSRRCGRYRLIRLLGAGGMGAVYLGERLDGEIEHRAAIKLLRADADRPAWRDRFLRERQLLAYLNHTSIARLLDAGHTDEGRPYLVMEYVDGVPLDEYAAPLDLRSRLALFLRVCEGVAHAHRRLIVHRDLKPSNILVDATGQPKLLDFGIAKLLDVTMEETRTLERLLTPEYASPEQLRGDVQTTATDIYSLGAVLHKLLTGCSPRQGLLPADPAAPRLSRDLEHILGKALRDEPDERYPSVDALAADIRAFLESRPVEARAGDPWYRIRKFLRRRRMPVAVTSVAAVALLLGWSLVSEQRAVARVRSLQVRELANSVLALGEAGSFGRPSSPAVYQAVALSKEHLETLAGQARGDRRLALEVGNAYSFLARVQGINMASTPGQRTQAEESLRKAAFFVEPVLDVSPDSREALLTAARISHDRMILAENQGRHREALVEGQRAAAYLERLLRLGALSEAERETVSGLFYEIALSHKNQQLAEEGIRYARRSVEVSGDAPGAARGRSLALSMLADLLRITGDLEGALLAIREARASLDKARFPSEMERRASWCRVVGREAKILGAPSGLSLRRYREAAVLHRQVFEVLEGWAQADPDDTWSRLLFASVGRELGDVLREFDPQQALDAYDHALRRLAEVPDNLEARRGEAELLAESSYALRRLHRPAEASERIETAFRLLASAGDYPAGIVAPFSAAYEALRASGDHLAETGRPHQALEVYEDLLSRLMASAPKPRNELRHALALSDVYASLAALCRRAGRAERREALSALRLELWLDWDARLPGNGIVLRQLASARPK